MWAPSRSSGCSRHCAESNPTESGLPRESARTIADPFWCLGYCSQAFQGPISARNREHFERASPAIGYDREILNAANVSVSEGAMRRRNFSKLLGLGVIELTHVTEAAPGVIMQRRVTSSEKKQWAREHLRGLGSLVMPSLLPISPPWTRRASGSTCVTGFGRVSARRWYRRPVRLRSSAGG